MNLSAAIELYGYGTSEGVTKAWDTRGRTGQTNPPPQIPKEVYEDVDRYKAILNDTAQRFKEAVGNYGMIESRLKTPESLYEKMQRKGKTIDQVGDVIGMRVTTKDFQNLQSAVEGIRKNFNVIKEDDKTKNPLGAYRAFHIDVDLGDGKRAEIQVRTENESKMAGMMHDTIYKGGFKNNSYVNTYFLKLSNALYRMDRNMKAVLPKCPEPIKERVGCFEPAAGMKVAAAASLFCWAERH